MKLDQKERNFVDQAIVQLEIEGLQGSAEAIKKLLHYEAVKPWLDEDLIDQMVKILYPPRAEWTEEENQRAFRHFKLALTLNHEILNEDVRTILKMAQHVKS